MRLGKESTGHHRKVAALVLLFVLLTVTVGAEEEKFFLPLFTYMAEDAGEASYLIKNSISEMIPLYGYGEVSGNAATYTVEEIEAKEEVTLQILEGEGEEGSRPETESYLQENMQSASGASAEEAKVADDLALQELLLQENQMHGFVEAKKVMSYDLNLYKDYETLLSTFYTIDQYALAGSDLFNIESFMGTDLSIPKGSEEPQILIYHTHASEGYADSAPGDPSQTVVGVGDFLAKILTEQYGYTVLHHTEVYDTQRDDAYGNSLPGLQKVLEENPSIQVVIDLHRDAANPARNMVMDIDGRKTARFMFFNGISRSTQNGNIDYLYNPYLSENLAFSFQMQKVAGEYYPGLTRNIYVKQYRYNMHLRGRSLLVELGDNSNTLEEAMNACYPLAHMLDLVLSGQVQ